MLQSIIDRLFGCSHQHTTFPLTPARKAAGHTASGAARNGTYVACLDCGKELAYDWDEMRIGQQVPPQMPARETQPGVRATA